MNMTPSPTRLHGVDTFISDASCAYANDSSNSGTKQPSVLQCKRNNDETLHKCNASYGYWVRFGNSWHCVSSSEPPASVPFKCMFSPNEEHPQCTQPSFKNDHHYLHQPWCCTRDVPLKSTSLCSSTCRTMDKNGHCIDGDTLLFTGHSIIADGTRQKVLCTKQSVLACKGRFTNVDGCNDTQQ